MQTLSAEIRIPFYELMSVNLFDFEKRIKNRLAMEIAEVLCDGCKDFEWVELISCQVKHYAKFYEYTDLELNCKVVVADYDYYK